MENITKTKKDEDKEELIKEKRLMMSSRQNNIAMIDDY